MHQLVLDLLPETPPSFDNFVVGANDEALTGLMAWLAPTCDESALLLWGETGSGKTHLLRASEGLSATSLANSSMPARLHSTARYWFPGSR